MPWQRVRTFVGRLFAPGQYLGLHLTIGLLLTLATLIIFIILTRDIREGRGGLDQFDHQVAKAMGEHAGEHPALLHFFRFVTQLGGYQWMTGMTLVGTLVLLARRRRLLALVWLVAALGGVGITGAIKETIDRKRPANPDAAVREHNASYFSGHSMGSVVGYGMLAYIALLRLQQRRLRTATVTGLVVLVLLIGFSRIYLRAHYFTDVLGGYCIGTVWLASCISGLEVVRRRHDVPPKPGAPARDVTLGTVVDAVPDHPARERQHPLS
jgi:undecaprenyl-diphosphatase